MPSLNITELLISEQFRGRFPSDLTSRVPFFQVILCFVNFTINMVCTFFYIDVKSFLIRAISGAC